MKGKHAGPSNTHLETQAFTTAATGHLEDLRGRRHKTGAIHVIRALRNAWNHSTERAHTGATA